MMEEMLMGKICKNLKKFKGFMGSEMDGELEIVDNQIECSSMKLGYMFSGFHSHQEGDRGSRILGVQGNYNNGELSTQRITNIIENYELEGKNLSLNMDDFTGDDYSLSLADFDGNDFTLDMADFTKDDLGMNFLDLEAMADKYEKIAEENRIIEDYYFGVGQQYSAMYNLMTNQ